MSEKQRRLFFVAIFALVFYLVVRVDDVQVGRQRRIVGSDVS